MANYVCVKYIYLFNISDNNYRSGSRYSESQLKSLSVVVTVTLFAKIIVTQHILFLAFTFVVLYYERLH